jgi:hypothetical protein
MNTPPERRVDVSRTMAVGPEPIFALLADPARHPEIDGSKMLRAAAPADHTRLQLGDTFSMRMRQARVPYSTVNTVVEYETDRLIAWETWAMLGRHKLFGGQRWRYRLTPEGDRTLVTESYDWSTARIPALIELGGYPARMGSAMSETLERLDRTLAGGDGNRPSSPVEPRPAEAGAPGAAEVDGEA